MSLVNPPATIPIRSIQWALKQPHQANRSGWTGRRQVLTTPGGSYWSCSAELIDIKGETAAKKWRAFFNSLEGQVHYFPVIAVESKQHNGSNPTIVSGAAGAKTVTLSVGAPALVAGDYMTIKLSDNTYQLVMLTAPISGGTAKFVPALRNTAATGAGSVETVYPYAHVSLVADSFDYSVSQGQMYSFAFTAEEAF